MATKRQIILDTETTGLNPADGHRIIEIGAVELLDRQFTGNNFHRYLNPGRNIDSEAVAVHGLTKEFLADKPLFSDIYQEFLKYIEGSELIIHNAPFDLGFLNYELKLLNQAIADVGDGKPIFDTLVMARKKHPGQRNTLDALCKRYKVDNSNRDLHGALLDAKLLAEVYLRMTGGQKSLFSEENLETSAIVISKKTTKLKLSSKHLPIVSANEEELVSHHNFLQHLRKKDVVPLWEQLS